MSDAVRIQGSSGAPGSHVSTNAPNCASRSRTSNIAPLQSMAALPAHVMWMLSPSRRCSESRKSASWTYLPPGLDGASPPPCCHVTGTPAARPRKVTFEPCLTCMPVDHGYRYRSRHAHRPSALTTRRSALVAPHGVTCPLSRGCCALLLWLRTPSPPQDIRAPMELSRPATIVAAQAWEPVAGAHACACLRLAMGRRTPQRMEEWDSCVMLSHRRGIATRGLTSLHKD